MTSVKTYAGETVVKDYKLTYEQSPATQRSRLKTLQECDGGATQECLQAEAYSWTQRADGFIGSAVSWPLPVAAGTGGYMTKSDASGTWINLIDMNGDGLLDLYNSGQSAVWLNTGTGFATNAISWPLPVAAGTGGYMTKSNASGTYLNINDINGDGLPDIYASGGSGLYLAVRSVNNKISTLTPGLSSSINVTYKPLTEASVYVKDSGVNAAVYPIQDVQSPMYVVSTIVSTDGSGGVLTSNYQYGGAKVDLNGRGFLGFRWMKSASPDSDLSIMSYYRQDYPYIGLPQQTEKRTLSGNTLLSASQPTYNNTALVTGTATSQFPHVTAMVEQNYELDGSLVSTTNTQNQYDAHGNVTQVTVTSHDGYVKTTTNTYVNDTANWLLGRLIKSTVISTAP
jgi:hypothetical protein